MSSSGNEGKNLPILTFVIPTYNFGAYISETIDSIFGGLKHLSHDDLEVVVLDGGSTDDTQEVVASLVSKYSSVKYYRNAERGGIDRDLDEAAKLASGNYIWMFSADDTLLPGWDYFVLQALDGDPDVVLIPAILCSLKMKIIRHNPILSATRGDKIDAWSFGGNEEDVVRYIEAAKTLEALFSFLSAVIVRSSRWKDLPAREDYFGTCWAHSARLMPLLFQRSKIIYVSEFLIKKRGENDSFMENGLVNRIAISINGWTRIIEEFFPSDRYRKILYAKLRRDISLPLLLYAKISNPDKFNQCRLHDLAKQHYIFNSSSAGTLFDYAVFTIFPKSPLILRIVNRNLKWIKLARHQMRRVL